VCVVGDKHRDREKKPVSNVIIGYHCVVQRHHFGILAVICVASFVSMTYCKPQRPRQARESWRRREAAGTAVRVMLSSGND
jgi:hypothetical protein